MLWSSSLQVDREEGQGRRMVESAGTYVLVLPWDLAEQGGVTRVVQELDRSIAEQGWMTPIVAVDAWDAPVPRKSGSVWHLRLAITGCPDLFGILKALLRLPVALWRLHKWLSAIDARVVNFHFPALSPLGVLALKALRLYRGRLILSFHGSDVRPPGDRLEHRLTPLLHERSDALVACSESLADRLSDTFAVPRDRVHVIHNGVDPTVFFPDAPLPEGLPEPVPAAFVLSVGSFKPGKDQGTLLRAFRRLAERHPTLHLLLAGPEGPVRVSLVREAETLGLGRRVRALAGLNPAQVAFLLSRCRVCVQPSLSESFPLAILEAGAAGATMVASRIAGHAEILEEGKDGLMFPVRDVEACAAAIETVLADRERARAMAEALRSKVLSRFTWSTCAEAYRSLAVD
jgi:glycosyltransferase involved in cell wall biosynthesis